MNRVPKIRFKEFRGEWEENRLGDLINYKKGFAFKSENYTENGIRIIRISDTNYNSIKNENPVYINIKNSEQYRAWELLENDLIVTTVGSRPPLYDSMVGKIIKVPKNIGECFLNQNAVRLRALNDYIQNFIYQNLNKKNYILHIESIVRGNANQVSITLENLFDYIIAVPTFQEQEKIADFLSSVDIKIEKLESKKELWKEYKKCIMQKIFSQEIRFKDENGDKYPQWKEKRLGTISSNVMYGMNVAATSYDGENKYIRITDISEENNRYNPRPILSPKGELEEKFIVNDNDILFTRTGASTGKTYIYDKNDGKLYFAGFLIRFNINEGNEAKYIFYQTQTRNYNKWLKVMSMRSGQPGINAEEYKKLKFNLPSYEEQKKIADFLSSIDFKIEIIEKKLEGMKDFKKGLLQGMFV